MINKKLVTIGASALGAFAFGSVYVSEKCLKTTEYVLDTGKLKNSVKAAVVSDLHYSKFGKDNKNLVKEVKNINPDIILIPGDFFDKHSGTDNIALAKKTLESFSSIAPVYFSPGNHDLRYNAATGDDCLKYAEEAGCTVLNGNYEDIVVNNEKIRIGGSFDHGVYLEDYGEKFHDSKIYAFLRDFEKTDSVKLVLMHRPNTFIYTDDSWNIDAVFCGHDHGGLWRLPIIGGVYAPEQGFFPKYDKGEYDFGKMKMFLSSGLEGYYFIPRLFNRPEVLSVTVK